MSQLTSSWSEKADVTNTDTEQTVTGEVHQFKPEAFLELIGAFSSTFNARSVLDGVLSLIPI